MFKNKFLIRINYKSGHSEEFWCANFSVQADGSLKWEVKGNKRPLRLSFDHSNIESIWQISDKKYWSWR